MLTYIIGYRKSQEKILFIDVIFSRRGPILQWLNSATGACDVINFLGDGVELHIVEASKCCNFKIKSSIYSFKTNDHSPFVWI